MTPEQAADYILDAIPREERKDAALSVAMNALEKLKSFSAYLPTNFVDKTVAHIAEALNPNQTESQSNPAGGATPRVLLDDRDYVDPGAQPKLQTAKERVEAFGSKSYKISETTLMQVCEDWYILAGEIADELDAMRRERDEAKADFARAMQLGSNHCNRAVKLDYAYCRERDARLATEKERDEANQTIKLACDSVGMDPNDSWKNLPVLITPIVVQRDTLLTEREEMVKALIEERAMAIYDGLKKQDGWVPWVVNGNSTKQDECRTIARANYARFTNPKP